MRLLPPPASGEALRQGKARCSPDSARQAAANIGARRYKGLLLAIAGVVLVSVNFVTAKYALTGYNSFTFLPLWFGTASVASTVYVLLYGPAWRAQVRRNLWPLLGVGFTNGIAGAMIFAGLAYLDPSVTAFLARSGALYAMVLGYIFLGERFSLQCLAGMALILAGVVLITYSSAASELVGVVLVLVGYIFGSLNYLFGKKAIGDTNPVVLIWMRSLVSLVVALAVAVISGRFNFQFSASHLSVLVLGALIGPFLGQMVSFYSLRYIGLSELEMMRATQPLMVLIYALVFLGMLPNLRQGLGGGVAIIGVILLIRARSVERAPLPPTN